MPLPTTQTITDLFARDPASFQFATSNPGNPPRTVGGREGAALQIDGPPDAPSLISMAVVLPPDNEQMARRGGMLLVLMLTLLDREWGVGEGSDWLLTHLRTAAYDARLLQTTARTHNGRRFLLNTDKTKSIASLTITEAQ